MTSYKLHSLQQLKDTDKPTHENFCTQMQAMLEQDCSDDHFMFSDKATFHLAGKVKHNTHIWETEHPHLTLDYVQDPPGQGCVLEWLVAFQISGLQAKSGLPNSTLLPMS